MELQQFLRTSFEPLQYLAFFGTLLILSGIELVLPRRDLAGQRSRRWPTNYGLTVLNILVMSSVPVSGLIVADWVAANGWGALAAVDAPSWLAITIGVALRSLGNFAVHFAMHACPPLWRIHRVHHTDTFIDVSTAVRFHPLEFAIQMPISFAVIVAFGIPPIAIIIYELLDAAMAVWTHANVRLPRWLDRGLGLFLVTPDMHRVHHSTRPQETDSNFGATLSVWDRLFGTLRRVDEPRLADMVLGLNEVQDERSRSLLFLLRLPFIARLARSKETGPS